MGSLGNLLKANGMGWGILQLLPLVNMLKTLQGLTPRARTPDVRPQQFFRNNTGVVA